MGNRKIRNEGRTTRKSGACGSTIEDENATKEQKVTPVVIRRRSLTDFQVFTKQVSERIQGNKQQNTLATADEEKTDVNFQQREYDTNKIVVSSQPLTPVSTKDQTLNNESPVLFVNEEDLTIQNEDPTILTILAEISFSDTEVTVVDLPEYVKNNRIPNITYNNIDPTSFVNFVDDIYEEIVSWKKNLFQVPTGKCGKAFIKLITDWINNFNSGNSFQGIALKVIMILPGLLLQKPSSTSKTRDHIKILEERLKLWNEGKLIETFKQCKVIQKKLQAGKQRTDQDISRIFSKLMFEGKVHAALKFLDENVQNTVLQSNSEVIEKLKKLHPRPADILPNTLLHGPVEEVDPAHFYNINEQLVFKAANLTKGSGGPSLMDANQWRRVLCSNHFKTEGKELREGLATFARKIAVEVMDPSILETYTSSRLIPLNKTPGETDIQIRPIGVGEVLRRIVGKTISWALNEEIKEAAGPLQVSTGLNGGAEAAIHAMKIVFENESTDGVILVDAENAFNKLNRSVALHNIRYLCPPLATILINTYRQSGRLFISGGGEIPSQEGTTQGDTLAMSFYGISVTPILQKLKEETPEVSQVWFADDATGGGTLHSLKMWWDRIISEGKKYGYHVKPSKSWLILKDPSKLRYAEELFQNAPINITTSGKRHLGAAIGTHEFKNDYIEEKVGEWCKQITKLSEIAKSQPHAAYSAYMHGEQHKFTYFLRTLSNISQTLKPVDDIINNTFIPALFGCNITEAEREILALPIKDGGLGIRTISDNAEHAYKASVMITAPLTKMIVAQSDCLPKDEDVKKAKTDALTAMRTREADVKNSVINKQPARTRRSLEQTSEPGASSWLGALPIQKQGFDLNKGEFQDALCMRYDKPLKNLPSKCACGAVFNITHAMNCHRGGFINARHDMIRNFDSKLLENVCNDVELEPQLQKVTGGTFSRSANTSDEARLDIRARGFWRHGQNSFFDIRVTNADCESQKEKSVQSILRKHEMEKKRTYNTRIMEVEHGTFTPIVLTVKGVMGHECQIFHKSLAEKLSTKKGEKYEDIIRYIRIKLSFLVLKAALLCLRGSRSKGQNIHHEGDDFAYNLNELNL